MSKAANDSRTFRHTPFLFVLAILSPTILGCQGCQRDPGLDGSESTSSTAAVTSKAIEAYPQAEKSERIFVKPGHWTTIAQSWQANDKDVRGTLEVSATTAEKATRSSSSQGSLVSARSATLPKGQSKVLETRVLVPSGVRGERGAFQIQSQLSSADLSIPSQSPPKPATALKAHEYFFVVLTTRPALFSGLQNASWARVIRGAENQQPPINYRVVVPHNSSGTYAIPETFFEWTSVAYVLWDDLAPEALTPSQRRALADWVHWGGQLLCNGPSAGEELSDSELEWLLPLRQVRNSALEGGELKELVQTWSLPTDTAASSIQAILSSDIERVGVNGTLRAPLAKAVAPNCLVWEQPIGNGHCRMTGFDLTSGWLKNWNSYESYFNAILLRRPPRVYEAMNGELVQTFAGELQGKELDARLSTRLRIFSRDAFFPSLEKESEKLASSSLIGRGEVKPSVAEQQPQNGPSSLKSSPAFSNSPWFAGYRRELAGEDIGSWNEKNDVAGQALEVLRDEAGITVPDIRFVAKAIGIYLLLLIPVNYLIFWLIGRLELAWFMIPVFGIIGALWIAREAQLDIGFARSRTELAVLEIQPGYERAMLTRYLALYNSLSTTYSIDFPSRDAVAAPIAAFESNPMAPGIFRQGIETDISLAEITIPSNQTLAIHTEQFVDVAGTLRYEELGETSNTEDAILYNDTELEFADVMVLRKDSQGVTESKYFASVLPKSTTKIRWMKQLPSFPEGLPPSIHRILETWIKDANIAPGSVRMVGQTLEFRGEFSVVPASAQAKTTTLMIANLKIAELPYPTKDENLSTDIDQKLLDESAGDFGEDFSSGANP